MPISRATHLNIVVRKRSKMEPSKVAVRFFHENYSTPVPSSLSEHRTGDF